MWLEYCRCLTSTYLIYQTTLSCVKDASSGQVTAFVSTGVRADSVAVDWLGRNLYWIDGVNSKIVAIRLATTTVNSLNHSVILDEDLDQPRSLALFPQKG